MSGRAMVAAGLLLLCLQPKPGSGQPRAGLHGGLTRSSLVLDSRDTGFRRGYVGGGWIRFPLVGAVGLQLGAYYTQKGSSDSIEEATLGIELDYLTFPLGFAFLFNRTEPTSGYLLTGGTFAVKRGCRVSAAVGDAAASVDCESTGVNDGPEFFAETLDLSLLIGGGVEFDRGPIILTLDLRSEFGFSDAISIITRANEFNDDPDNGANLSFAAMVGIAFNLGPRPTR